MKKKDILIGCISIFVIAGLFVSRGPVFSYLNKERAYIKKKSKAVALGYYLPSFEQLANIVSGPSDDLNIDNQSFIGYYEKALEAYPHLVNAPAMLGFFYARDKQPEKAISAYQKAIKANPHFFWNHYNLAVVYFKENNYQSSLLSIKEALGKKPEVVFFVVNKSPVYKQIWRYIGDIEQQVVQNYRSGVEDIYALLVLNLYKLENYDAALNAGVSAIKSDFKDKSFFSYFAGLSALQLGKPNEAILFFNQAIAANPGHALAYYSLSKTYEVLGQPDAAIAMQEAAQNLIMANGEPASKENQIFPRIF